MSDATTVVIGYLGQDPHISKPKGKTVANFSVAVNRKIGGSRATMWVKVELWNPLPEILAGLKAGAYVRVLGSLFPDEWTGKDNVVHRDFVVKYPQVLLLDRESGPTNGRDQAPEIM